MFQTTDDDSLVEAFRAVQITELPPPGGTTHILGMQQRKAANGANYTGKFYFFSLFQNENFQILIKF